MWLIFEIRHVQKTNFYPLSAFQGIKTSKHELIFRYVPGSQPPFSLIPDPDHNKEDTSFISVVANDLYIPLSRPIQFCLLPSQKFEKNNQGPGDPGHFYWDPAEPWIQDPSGFLPI